MKNYFKFLLLCGVITFSLAACVGHADSDGHPSMEGSSDPANNGGKLSGDHSANSPANVNDSLSVK